jgi:hypothetical protein
MDEESGTMSSFEELVSLTAGQSVLGGWDAVCAMSMERVNAMFLQQFLQSDPTSPKRLLQVITAVNTDLWILEVALGPALISFETTSAQITMPIVRGSLTCVDSIQGTITNVLQIAPDSAYLTGPLSLSSVKGSVTGTGQVWADLAANAWIPAIESVDQIVATQIGQAIQAFFTNNPTQYELGGLGSSDVQACLTPTAFFFALQAPPVPGGDGCVLLLIQTTGQGGPVQPLPSYPIPDGSTAALLISNEVIFSGLIPSSFNSQFASAKMQFSGQQSDGAWTTTSSGGSIGCGIIQGTFTWGQVTYPFSCDSALESSPQSVAVPGDAFTACAAGGAIALNWAPSWNQYWCYLTYVAAAAAESSASDSWNMPVYTPTWSNCGLVGSYSMTANATVGANNVISFSGSPTVSFGPQSEPDWWQKNMEGDWVADTALTSAVKNQVSAALGSLTLPDVNTFSLVNLLFPAQHAISLSTASVPCDLLAVGLLQAPLTVTPETSKIAPGATVQMTATDTSGNAVSANWEVSYGAGTISANGLYTAPAAISQPELNVVTAINTANTQQTGGSMVIVANAPPASALQVSPGTVSITSGQNCVFQISDGQGNAIAATCALNPEVGSIRAGLQTGEFIYTAPASVASPQSVSLVATSTANSAESGTASLTLLPATAVTVTPAGAGTVVAGGTLAISAGANGISSLEWIVYPMGTGAVTPDPDNSLSATYTAPASVTGETNVTIVAFNADEGAVGLASVTVTEAS